VLSEKAATNRDGLASGMEGGSCRPGQVVRSSLMSRSRNLRLVSIGLLHRLPQPAVPEAKLRRVAQWPNPRSKVTITQSIPVPARIPTHACYENQPPANCDYKRTIAEDRDRPSEPAMPERLAGQADAD